jgi:Xaa-Pro aminopeptidase
MRLLHALSLSGAVITGDEMTAHLTGFEFPTEDYPVANPYVRSPATTIVSPTAMRLITADFYAASTEPVRCEVSIVGSYDHMNPPDEWGGYVRALREAVDQLGLAGPIGVEADALPLSVAHVLEAAGLELVDIKREFEVARKVKSGAEVEALRGAARCADVVQAAIKERAAPGVSEAELAEFAHAALAREVGRRIPAFLNVTSGPPSAAAPWEATGRIIERGDLVLCDVAPWYLGSWGDSANAVVVGTPSKEHRRVFDGVRRALDLAISLARPGARACDIHTKVRDSLSEFGSDRYDHHTGHGLGASWSEDPKIVPFETMAIEEGMVLAMEPAVYREGWGGIRLEHMFVVGGADNELLTQFEHTL